MFIQENSAFTAEDTAAISLPTAHSINTALFPPKGWALLSLTDAATQSPGSTAPARIYTQLHPDFQRQWLGVGRGRGLGTLLPLLGVPALCLSFPERAGMTFPKGKANPWGIQ